MNNSNYYRISELSRITSVPIPTIRYYLKEGLLPPAVKRGKTSAYYSDDHLDRLVLIKKLQTEERRALASIREELDRIPLKPAPDDNMVISSTEKRNEIISAAIDLFLKNGLDETSIDDIVNKASIGKGTFYKYFKDKNELFVECADSIFYKMYSHVWQEIKNERDMLKRLYKRSTAFFDSYPKWIDMMNLVRYASVGTDRFFKDKFNAVLNQIIRPIAHDLEVLKREGRIPIEIDCLGVAYLLMGMTEYGASLIYNGAKSAEEISDILRELLTNGLYNRNSK
jgi:AcrR family transcriptional regulator